MDKIKNIIRWDNRTFLEKLKVDWVFRTRLDKWFLILLTILSMYAIVRIISQGLW